MNKHPTNHERTADYFKKFDREKTIKYLIKGSQSFILDVGANIGTLLDEFKFWWSGGQVHCFEPQQECWVDVIYVNNRLRSGI